MFPAISFVLRNLTSWNTSTLYVTFSSFYLTYSASVSLLLQKTKQNLLFTHAPSRSLSFFSSSPSLLEHNKLTDSHSVSTSAVLFLWGDKLAQ